MFTEAYIDSAWKQAECCHFSSARYPSLLGRRRLELKHSQHDTSAYEYQVVGINPTIFGCVRCLVSLICIYVWINYYLDRSRPTTHPNFEPAGVQTHDLQIMTVYFMSLRWLHLLAISDFGLLFLAIRSFLFCQVPIIARVVAMNAWVCRKI